MKFLITFTVLLASISAFATSPIIEPQVCGSATLQVEAFVYADSLDLLSVKMLTDNGYTEVKPYGSQLQARLKGGSVYLVTYCPVGESMGDTLEKNGTSIIGCNIQASLVVCEN